MEVSTNHEKVNTKENVKLFSIPHRPTDDECAKDAKDTFNQSGFDYSITNFYDASRQSLIDFSSDQTNLRFQQGFGTPVSSAMDDSSKIRDEFGWNPRGRVQLNTRIYGAVPNLSHGTPNPEQESSLWHVKYDMVNREITEVDTSRFVPLIQPISQSIQDPKHIVPSEWVNGGEDTRGRLRDPEYLVKNGFVQDPVSGVWVRA